MLRFPQARSRYRLHGLVWSGRLKTGILAINGVDGKLDLNLDGVGFTFNHVDQNIT